MTLNSEKPVIAIVQGAWHRASHYKAFAESLTSKGFTVVQPDNVTAGDPEEIKGKTHLDDVEAIRKALQPSLDQGLSGGISHVIFVTAFAFPVKGLSLLAAIGGTHAPMVDRTVRRYPLLLPPMNES
jgi:hypothetical protein